MVFDWIEYYSLSKKLPSVDCGVSPEALYRCGVSRAYYASFNCVLKYATDVHQYKPPSSQTNMSAHAHLRKFMEPINFSTSNTMRILHELRKKCDYIDEIDNPSDVFIEAIDYAEDILADIGKIKWADGKLIIM